MSTNLINRNPTKAPTVEYPVRVAPNDTRETPINSNQGPFPQGGELAYQLLWSQIIQHDFNALEMSVLNGMVAVSVGDIPLQVGNNLNLVQPTAPWNYAFGYLGQIFNSGGASAGWVNLYAGPQFHRFKVKRSGIRLSVWVRPENFETTLSPLADPILVSGSVMLL